MGDRSEALVGIAAARARETARDRLAHRAHVVLPLESADRERPVVRVLRPAVLEDDHRGDDRASLDVRHVEALDPDRQALEVQDLTELLERGDAPRALLLSQHRVGLERQPRVLAGQIDQAALLASRGRAHVDPRPAPRREKLGENAGVGDPGWHEDLGRDARRRAVVLDRECLQHALLVLAGHVLEVEAVAVDHLPVAEREDLHRGLVAAERDPDHVDAPHRAPVRGLPLAQMLDREEPVAVAGGLLEALVRGGLAHPFLQLALDRLRVAGEEADDTLDDLAVVLFRDRADAGCEAAVDVEVEARDPRVPSRSRAFAGPKAEHAVQDVERLAYLLRIRVRAEIDGSGAVPLAREHDSRILVRERHGDVRERLVVA